MGSKTSFVNGTLASTSDFNIISLDHLFVEVPGVNCMGSKASFGDGTLGSTSDVNRVDLYSSEEEEQFHEEMVIYSKR